LSAERRRAQVLYSPKKEKKKKIIKVSSRGRSRPGEGARLSLQKEKRGRPRFVAIMVHLPVIVEGKKEKILGILYTGGR